MPRFVRAAWLEADADGRYSTVALGPRIRAGFLSGRVTLRTPQGGVSEAITFDAGGVGPSGAARMTIDVPERSFTVETYRSNGKVHVVIQPVTAEGEAN